jgi:hypothetical protein
MSGNVRHGVPYVIFGTILPMPLSKLLETRAQQQPDATAAPAPERIPLAYDA